MKIKLQRLLFKLHITNSYPITLIGVDGTEWPANVLRTDDVSYCILPGKTVRK